MKKLFNLIGTAAFAVVMAAAVPVVAMDLGSVDFTGADGKTAYKAVKLADDKTGDILLKIADKDGKELCKSETLGMEDRKFWFEKESKELHVADLNGDKTPEIMVSAFIGPKSSGLFVYQFDEKGKKLIPMQVSFPQQKDAQAQDMFVADIDSQDGSNMQVTAKGNVTVAGLVYKEGAEPEAAQYFFSMKDKGFVLDKTEKVPEPKEEPKPEGKK